MLRRCILLLALTVSIVISESANHEPANQESADPNQASKGDLVVMSDNDQDIAQLHHNRHHIHKHHLHNRGTSSHVSPNDQIQEWLANAAGGPGGKTDLTQVDREADIDQLVAHAPSKINGQQMQCVMCQYFVHKIDFMFHATAENAPIFLQQLSQIRHTGNKKNLVEMLDRVTQKGHSQTALAQKMRFRQLQGIAHPRNTDPQEREAAERDYKRMRLLLGDMPSGSSEDLSMGVDLFNHMQPLIKHKFNVLCNTRLPGSQADFCQPLENVFDSVAQELKGGNLPFDICQTHKFCSVLKGDSSKIPVPTKSPM